MKTGEKFNGKFILSGEHAVVYGFTALAGPIDKGICLELADGGSEKGEVVNKDLLKIFQDFSGVKDKAPFVVVKSNLPQRSGLGSSAAFSAATFSFLAEHFSISLNKAELFNLVQKAENIFHGNPSGIDAAVVVYGEFIRFQKNNNPEITELSKKVFSNLKKHQPLLVYSGKSRESTQELVSLVAEKRKLNKKKMDMVLRKIGKISEKIETGLKQGNFSPELITENQRLLEQIGVVGNQAKEIIKKIEKIGGVVKITGAGGVSEGSGYLFAIHPDKELFLDFLKQNKLQCFPVFA